MVLLHPAIIFWKTMKLRMESCIELCWIPTTAPPLDGREIGLSDSIVSITRKQLPSKQKNNKFCCMMERSLCKLQRPGSPPPANWEFFPQIWCWKSIRESESKIIPSFRSRNYRANWCQHQLAQKGQVSLCWYHCKGPRVKLGGGSAFGTHCGAGGKPSRGALFDQRFVFLHIFFLQIFGPKSLV